MSDVHRRLVDPDTPDSSALDVAAKLLRDRGLIVAPTETRYGLLVRADDPDAVARLQQVKGRAFLKPTALFVSDSAQMNRLGEMNSHASALARRFLPGPVTLVLKSRVAWEAPLVVDGKIGLRHSSSAVISGLLARTGFPCTATSANIADGPELETVDQIASQFGDSIDLYLDAGPLTRQTSTVVDCSGSHVTILREGAISKQQLIDTLSQAGLQ